MSAATRDSILAATKALRPVAVEVADLGGLVHVRRLSVGGMARYLDLTRRDPARAPLAMLSDALCDADGKRLFTPDDEPALADLPAETVQAILEKIGTPTEPQEAAKN